ncbi:MAG: phosphomannomutase [Gallionellaceae bacterium]|jgi:phosphomannomutase
MQIDELMLRSGVKFGTSGARGLVTEMSDEVCYAYVAAFLQAVAIESSGVVLGHDLRPSSPRIAAACAAAVRDAGREVIYVGALPTPAIAYYATLLGLPALVVTGSHIPFDRNGIKFYRAEGEISKQDELAMLQVEVNLPHQLTPYELAEPDGRAEHEYVLRYLNFFVAGSLSGQRVAVYEHSSVGRDVLRRILEGLGAEVISLGRTEVFVPIDTEAVRAEDVLQAKQWAGEYQFDAIVSTDGDADRPLIGDERGEWLRGDVVGILCAQFLHADVVVTPVSSNTAVELCRVGSAGDFKKVLRTKIGSPYVIAGMEGFMSQVVVGYEANGGFLLGSDVIRNGQRLAALPTRDAVLPMLALLALARERGCKVSQLLRDLPARFTASDRLQNFATELSRDLIARLLNAPQELVKILAPQSGEVTNIDQTDGLRVTFASGDIVHLRPSGNAPELRCYAEADTAEKAKQLCDACLGRMVSQQG